MGVFEGWDVRLACSACSRSADTAAAAVPPKLPPGPGAQVSARAKKRGLPQMGTLGAGNHYAEVQAVEKIYDVAAARKMGIDQARALLGVALWRCALRAGDSRRCALRAGALAR